MTFTALPERFDAAAREWKRIVRVVRQRGFEFEWALVFERTKSGLRHAHVLERGSYVPQATLQAIAGRIVDVRRIRGAREVAGYAMKEALSVTDYATKGREELEDHLALNGGRVIRTSRGYYR